MGDDEEYDAVVIGSGYGGSVTACRMSVAGLKVCLVEKGRRWNAEDFPVNTFDMVLATRIESKKHGLGFGSKDALYQVHVQEDSVAAMACGLGGGSLVNAGVMVPATVRARRNPKWPKEWERDWELCESLASSMLKIQSVPVKFQNAKIMEEITAGEELEMKSEDPVKLSIIFDVEDQISGNSHKANSCLACGNCFGGCPYNAKNSNDKTYLATALQAGCAIRTESEVRYLVRSPEGECGDDKTIRTRKRWRIYFNDFDYIASDFVVVSAGVFGTTKILFESQMRGLILSERLGSGLSCNGNTVAYVSGSKAPLNAHGLDKKQLTNVPFENRPGPSISSSLTSSLGFTIQSAVLPTAYPWLLFKGIFTYGWPIGYTFFHVIIDKLKQLMKLHDSHDIILNAMGYDDCNGKLTFDKDANSLNFQPPSDPLLSRKIESFQKITKKLGGILFLPRFRSTSVHLLGGCNSSSNAEHGVCNSKGQVFDTRTSTSVHPGLYVCDASLIPCSVGINPSLAIATVSEHISKNLVKEILDYKIESEDFGSIKHMDENKSSQSSCKTEKSQRIGVTFEETLVGHVGGMPCTVYLKVKMNSGKGLELLKGKVAGLVICRGVERENLHIIDGDVNLCSIDNKTPYTQNMCYRLLLATSSGSRYVLEGKKVMNPFFFALNAWKESTSLHVVFKEITQKASGDSMKNLRGELYISWMELMKCLTTLRGDRKLNFLSLFIRSLFRTYILQIPRGYHKSFSPPKLHQEAYPDSTLHEVKTEDGVTIICQRWKSTWKENKIQDEKKSYPVLLVNGYATESYYLPTEPNDLVRTLLDEGHDVWLLHSRLHPPSHSSISSKYTTIEDIGRYDIPSAMNQIYEFHGSDMKIHVVGHCVGGLAVHIALMGGHVSCNKIASLSCTNSSMFFKLNAFSMVKMWLPLIPMSMAILGKDTNIPLLQTLKTSPRQKLLKAIARAMPRSERCTYDECEVFSGVFGNAFWHENVSLSMHHWMNKHYLPRLSMSAFPHVRKICKAGHIVDGNGNNSYLIHPERMALPTLYISGGRPILVTPETSFLANKYMKLHQPGFRHGRVVVDGFGHSDLLMGEESYVKVFPHILRHMSLAEVEKGNSINDEKRLVSKDALSWAEDPHEMNKGALVGRCIYAIMVFFFISCFYICIRALAFFTTVKILMRS